MSVADEGGPAAGLIRRVQDMLLRPKPTWETIDGEAATVQGLYTGYICILAAITPICTVLVGLLISPIFHFIAPFVLSAVVTQAVLSYALSLLGAYVFAFIADAMAPSFGATKGVLPALKVAAYGMTAVWVSGLCLLIPIVGGLGVLAGMVYSLYLVHLGLKQIMKVPADRALGYTIAAVLLTALAMSLLWRLVQILT